MDGRARKIHVKRWRVRSGRWFIAAGWIVAVPVFGAGYGMDYDQQHRVAPDEPLRFYVDEAIRYDDNLYRLSKNFGPAGQIAPGASRDDIVNRTILGAIAGAHVGRQHFLLKGQVADNRFRENDNLDNTSGNADAIWDWQVTNALSGKVQADYKRTLADFAYTRTPVKDVLEQQTYSADARLRITPRWSLTGKGESSRVDHGAAVAADENTKTDSWSAGVLYETPRDDEFGFDYTQSHTRLPDYVVPPGGMQRDYRDKKAEGWLDYAYSVKTHVQLRAGHVQRRYDRGDVGNFSGTTGRVTLQWQPGYKTRFELSVWRELQAYLELGSEYFVARGASVEALWTPTDTFRFDLQFSRSRNDYRTESMVPLTASPARLDNLYSGTFTASYLPRDYLTVKLAYSQQWRDSNQALQDFIAHIVTLGVRLQF